MSSTKSVGRPRSWFGIKLGSKSSKGNKENPELSIEDNGHGISQKVNTNKDKNANPKKSGKNKSKNKPKSQDRSSQSVEDSDFPSNCLEIGDKSACIEQRGECREKMISSVAVATASSAPPSVGNSAKLQNQRVHSKDFNSVQSHSGAPRLQSASQNKALLENATSTNMTKKSQEKTVILDGAPQDSDGQGTSSLHVGSQPRLQQQQLQQQQQPVSPAPHQEITQNISPVHTAQPSISTRRDLSPSLSNNTSSNSKFKTVSFSTSTSASSPVKIPQLTAAAVSTTTTTTTTTTTAGGATPTVKIAPTPRYNLNFIGDLQSKHKFSLAVCKQNDVANSAIQSLGSLNEQIVQYILSAYTTPDPGSPSPLPSPSSPDLGDPAKDVNSIHTGRVPSSTDSSQTPAGFDSCNAISHANLNLSSPAAHASMVIIRRLLVDAQTRFRRMVEDNRQLAAHIDTSIQSANQEVCLLRAELASTNRKLNQMNPEEMARADVATQVELSSTKDELNREKEASYKEDAEALMKANEQLVEEYRHLLQDHKSLSLSSEEMKVDNERLLGECSRLEAQLRSLSMDYEVLVREVKAEVSPGQQGQSLDPAGGQEVQGSGDGEGQGDEAPKNEGSVSDSTATGTATATAVKLKPPVAPRQSYGELKLELIQSRQELNRAKEMLHGMKCDRKRLKGEKLDLLGQIKQLYTTLEDKETELRDFIKNYEQRVKESDEMIKQLAKEKAKAERDKWDIVTRAKDASERAVSLKAQLDVKDAQLVEARKQLSSQDSEPGADVVSTKNTTTDNKPTIIDDDEDTFVSVDDNGFSTLEESSVLNCTIAREGSDSCTQTSPRSPGSNTSGSTSPSGQTFRWFTQSSDLDLAQGDSQSLAASGDAGGGGGGGGTAGGKGDGEGGGSSGGGLLGVGKTSRGGSKKKKTNGIGESLSRVFSRSKMRRSLAIPHAEAILADCGPKLSVLNQDNYQEKLATIEKMVGLHMREWRAHQVLAWLEITLAMPMYAHNCLSNVKSGKILLGLSDSELSAAMGVTNAMHRRKLRLAIEQHRNPDEITYIKASEMDPTWVSHRLLPDLGLAQHTQVFEEQLCDGHVLNTLTRRDLEKHFSVHRKFHQSSILHAVELLRRIDFNKEKLYHRRNLIEDKDNDLIVWTNERLIKWLRSIDLGEYSEALLESGVHGALMVLEPSFNTDSLAAILGISPSKSYITRHLATELDKILKPARAALDPCDLMEKSGESNHRGKGSVSPGVKPGNKIWQDKDGKLGQESDKTPASWADRERRKSQEEGRSRLSFRGSIGRAFGKKIGNELRLSKNSNSPKPRISAPVPLVVSPAIVSKGSPDLAGLLQKGFCVKEPPNFQRTRSLVINVDRAGRVVTQSGEGQGHEKKSRTSDATHKLMRRPKSCSENLNSKSEPISANKKASQSKRATTHSQKTRSISDLALSKQAPSVPKTKPPVLKLNTVSNNKSPKTPVAGTPRINVAPGSRNSTIPDDESHKNNKTRSSHLPKTGEHVSKQSFPSNHSPDCRPNQMAREITSKSSGNQSDLAVSDGVGDGVRAKGQFKSCNTRHSKNINAASPASFKDSALEKQAVATGNSIEQESNVREPRTAAGQHGTIDIEHGTTNTVNRQSSGTRKQRGTGATCSLGHDGHDSHAQSFVKASTSIEGETTMHDSYENGLGLSQNQDHNGDVGGVLPQTTSV